MKLSVIHKQLYGVNYKTMNTYKKAERGISALNIDRIDMDETLKQRANNNIDLEYVEAEITEQQANILIELSTSNINTDISDKTIVMLLKIWNIIK